MQHHWRIDKQPKKGDSVGSKAIPSIDGTMLAISSDLRYASYVLQLFYVLQYMACVQKTLVFRIKSPGRREQYQCCGQIAGSGLRWKQTILCQHNGFVSLERGVLVALTISINGERDSYFPRETGLRKFWNLIKALW